eukprot:4605001-Amphidinium_carterae.1
MVAVLRIAPLTVHNLRSAFARVLRMAPPNVVASICAAVSYRSVAHSATEQCRVMVSWFVPCAPSHRGVSARLASPLQHGSRRS